MNGDTNILASIRGEYVADGGKQLPPVETTDLAEARTTLEVLYHGLVIFTFERKIHRRGRDRSHYWVAVRAVCVQA